VVTYAHTAIEQFSMIEFCQEYFLIIEVVRLWRVQMMIWLPICRASQLI